VTAYISPEKICLMPASILMSCPVYGKMSMGNKLLAAILTYLIVSCASAVSIGAGPSVLEYDRMARGGYAERTVTVGTSGQDDLFCTIEFTGEIADWMSTDKGGYFTLPGKGRTTINVVMQPPYDAVNGKYSGAMYIKASPTSEVGGGAGLAVGAGIKININAQVVGEEIIDFAVTELKVSDTEVGYPIIVSALVENTGNIRAAPKFTSELLGGGRTILSSEYSGEPILPARHGKIEFSISSDGLSPGEYLINVTAYAGEKIVHTQTLPVEIMPSGTLTVSGDLREVYLSVPEAQAGEIVKIIGVFENTGVVPVKARLRAEAYLGSKLMEVIDGLDTIQVSPGAIREIEAYYTPTEAGNYVIRANVLYGDSRTDTKAAILKASGGSGLSLNLDTLLLIIALIMFSIVIYYKLIRKQGQSPPYYPPPGQYPPKQPPKPQDMRGQTLENDGLGGSE
jgi:hypothetical protein